MKRSRKGKAVQSQGDAEQGDQVRKRQSRQAAELTEDEKNLVQVKCIEFLSTGLHHTSSPGIVLLKVEKMDDDQGGRGFIRLWESQLEREASFAFGSIW